MWFPGRLFGLADSTEAKAGLSQRTSRRIPLALLPEVGADPGPFIGI
jgi:hypothetical protein